MESGEGSVVNKTSVLQTINRHINCLGEENRATRKRAIEGIKKETLNRKPALEQEVLTEVSFTGFTEDTKHVHVFTCSKPF